MKPGTREFDLKVDRHLSAALDLPDAERADYLDRECPDPAVRSEVEVMLHLARSPSPGLDSDVVARFAVDSDLFAPRESEHEPEIGRRFGAWRVIGELGRGGMGVVYRVERADGAFEQTAALKRMLPASSSPGLRQRFERERQILAALSHPNIARLLDGGYDEDGHPFLVLEEVPGRPIDEHCDAESLGVEERIALVIQVARAVEHAHRNLVVHRDLKPSNVVVTPDGEVKLLDFGIAKLLEEGFEPSPEAVTHTLTMFTPRYASPEQVRGEPTTTASDVFQLGLVLFELLTGRRAQRVESSSPREIERAVCETPTPRPSREVTRARDDEASRVRRATWKSLSRRLKGDLDAVVLTALHKEPELRYGSVGDLVADLEDYLAGRPVRARGQAWTYRAGKFLRRHPGLSALSAGLALSLIGFSVVTVRHARELEREQAQVRVETEKAEQVIAFLVGLFEAADPSGEKGVETTAGELLEAGLREIESAPLEPAVRGRILGVLGDVYGQIGDLEGSNRLIEESLAILRGVHGGDHPDLADALIRSATRAQSVEELDESDRLAREALEMRRRLHGGRHRSIVESLDLLATNQVYRGDYAEAEKGFREALELQGELVAGDDAVAALLLNNLGVVLGKEDRLEEAAALHREALAMRRRLLPPGHAAIAESLNNLAVILRHQGEFAAALPVVEEALAIRREIFGSSHIRVANTLGNLGLLYRIQGRYDEAERSLREALAIRRAALGPGHSNVGLSLHQLGTVVRDRGDRDGAERLFRDALSILRETLGADHRVVGQAEASLGELLRVEGRLDEASSLLEDSLRILLDSGGDEGRPAALGRVRLGLCRAAQGRESEARELLAIALPIPGRGDPGEEDLIEEGTRALERLAQPRPGAG